MSLFTACPPTGMYGTQAYTRISRLTTGYMTNPIGIEADSARFGWMMESNVIGARQTAYQIKVFSEKSSRPIWNSGKVASGLSTGIACGADLQEETKYRWSVTVWNNMGKKLISDTATFETAVTNHPEWLGAEFIRLNSGTAGPVFRTEQPLQAGKVVSARLYITALGVYQAYVNGQDVVYRHMPPGYGNKNVSLGYQTYDVTSALKGHQSAAIGIKAGNGWYFGMNTTNASPAVKALLAVSYRNGDKQYIKTNTADWKGTLTGPVTMNGVYYGEDYDARLVPLLEGFSLPGFNDSAWIGGASMTTAAYPGKIHAEMRLAGGIVDTFEQRPLSVTTYTDWLSDPALPGGRINVNDHYAYEYPADTLYHGAYRNVPAGTSLFGNGITLAPGQTMVINMGQNLTAVPEFRFSGAPGARLEARFAEMLNDGSAVSDNGATTADGPRGSVYLKSLRRARAAIVYRFAGDGVETYQPSTSFFGYQYVSVTADQAVTIYSVRSRALSSVSEQTGFIKTNNANVNKLFTNTLYSQLSNYFTTATDCPQRDERQFWTGDTQAFAQTAMYNFDSTAFMESLQDIMSMNTMIKGYVPAVADNTGNEFFSNFAAGWSDAQIIVPWTMYRQTGDKSILSNNWTAMNRYMDFLSANERDAHQAPMIGGNNFGDWLSFQGTAVTVIADYYYGYAARLMADSASILGDSQKAARYSEKFESIKNKFLQSHVTFTDGKLVIASGNTASRNSQFQYNLGKGGVWEDNSQTSLLWMLKLGFYDNDKMRDAALNLMIDNIRNENPAAGSVRADAARNTLAVGFLGSNIILPVMTDFGHADMSYNLLLQDTLPSWIFEVKAGATTIWERWNSFVPGAGFGDREMNSFNHYAYGSVVEWMFRYMAGIGCDMDMPGFKSIVLQPTLDKGTQYNGEERIHSVDCSYNSYYGTIESSWRSDGGNLMYYRTVVPANTNAVLYLPVEASSLVGFTGINGVILEGMTERNGQPVAKITLNSGGYEFTITEGVLGVSYADGYVKERR